MNFFLVFHQVELLDEFYHTIPPGPTTWMASINDVYDQHVYTLLVEGLPNTINADDMWLGMLILALLRLYYFKHFN